MTAICVSTAVILALILAISLCKIAASADKHMGE